ncbi:MAG TPA: hypothetical protein VMF65_04545 [Acidimicrobiales bacterium]|nr:hypothetical protein [Acidimicrobiales bacterium]
MSLVAHVAHAVISPRERELDQLHDTPSPLDIRELLDDLVGTDAE